MLATAISGPARVYSTSSAIRLRVDPTTLELIELALRAGEDFRVLRGKVLSPDLIGVSIVRTIGVIEAVLIVNEPVEKGPFPRAVVAEELVVLDRSLYE